jgi:hypothetical protein
LGAFLVALLIVRAYLELVVFDYYRARRNFAALYDKVRNCPVLEKALLSSKERVCHAMELACILYFKEVLCLQRSAATTCLLRKYGVRAEMIIGTQRMPFQAHAWVEAEGNVVNDKSYIPKVYAVLDRC